MLKRSTYSIVGLLVVLPLLVACSEPPPEEKIAMARARYEAELSSFAVLQQPLEAAAPASEETEAIAEGEGEESGEEAWEETIDLSQNVLLDIVIRQDSLGTRLPGITLDISMADGEREIEVWRVWFDTSTVEKGPGVQYSHTLENVDYQPGYGFSAEVKIPIPAEERSQYREFDAVGD